MIFFAIFFLAKFIKSEKNINLVLFLASSLVALTSYHTGATAFVALMPQ